MFSLNAKYASYLILIAALSACSTRGAIYKECVRAEGLNIDCESYLSTNLISNYRLMQMAERGFPPNTKEVLSLVYSGVISDERKPILIRELSAALGKLPRGQDYYAIIIEDQKVAVDVFTQAIALHPDKTLTGVRLVYVGLERDKEPLRTLVDKKGGILSYVVRPQI